MKEINLKQRSLVVQYILFSIFAAMLLLIVAFFGISNETRLGITDKLFVSVFFIISCLIGISLTIYPGWIRRSLKSQFHNTTNKNIQKTARKREGHHPNCDQFKSHTIKIKNKIYCAGCLGIAIGCIISIGLMIIYIPISYNISSDIFPYLIILGFIIIGLVFIEIMLNKRNTYYHIISNSILVVSFLIIIISITELTGNKIYGIISIILSFLWLDTRIQLSNWHHSIICNNCNKSCKMY